MTELTFTEICPKWDKFLVERFNKEHLSDLCHWKDCVVGEANNYDEAYVGKCRGCYMYSVRFYSEAMNEHHYNKEFGPIKKDFIEHWDKEHFRK